MIVLYLIHNIYETYLPCSSDIRENGVYEHNPDITPDYMYIKDISWLCICYSWRWVLKNQSRFGNIIKIQRGRY